MNRRYFILGSTLLGLGAALMALPGCSSQADQWPEKPGPRVLTSFVPLYCFALNVAGDDATVRCLMSDTGPHHFDPGPPHARLLRGADLFLINGLELDDTIARKMAASARNGKLRLVEVAAAIPRSQLREGMCSCGHVHASEEEKKGGEHQVHYDPHVWLGIPEAIIMVEKIRDVLKEQDPSHAAGYDERAAKYVARLRALLEEGRKELAGKKERKIVTFHDSLSYFARAFGLEVVDSIESAPGNEPDPQKLSGLIAACKEKHVRVITVEPQYDSNTAAKRLLRSLRQAGIDAEFATVDPLETARPDELNAEYYETKMRANVRNLADTLK